VTRRQLPGAPATGVSHGVVEAADLSRLKPLI
jgi:hypothetical protein